MNRSSNGGEKIESVKMKVDVISATAIPDVKPGMMSEVRPMAKIGDHT